MILIHLLSCLVFFATSASHGAGWAEQYTQRFGKSRVKFYWFFVYKIAISLQGEYSNPTKLSETFCSVALSVLGNIIIGTILGLLVTIINRYQYEQHKRDNKLDEIKANIIALELPKELKFRIFDYYKYRWRRDKFVEYGHFLRSLPKALAQEVCICKHAAILEKVDIFKGCDGTFVKLLSTMLKLEVHSPGSVIIRQGEQGRKMYMIGRGVCQVLHEDANGSRTLLTELGKGKCVGEIGLVGSQDNMRVPRRSCTILAKEFVDLFTLTADDVQVCGHAYPGQWERMLANVGKKITEYTDIDSKARESLCATINLKKEISSRQATILKRGTTEWFKESFKEEAETDDDPDGDPTDSAKSSSPKE